jgi:hypothetical protein
MPDEINDKGYSRLDRMQYCNAFATQVLAQKSGYSAWHFQRGFKK